MRFWDLFQWWNLIFTLPFGVGMLPLLLQAMGAVHLSHAGHEIHLAGHHLPHSGGDHLSHLGNSHATIHGHVSAGVAPGHSTSLSTANTHPAPTHTATDTQSTHEPAHAPTGGLDLLSRLFSILGIGRVPLMLVLSIFCLIWGAAGVAANQIFATVLRTPALYVWPSMICAFLISYASTSGLSQLISRMMPQLETYGTEEELLVGRIARAAYDLGARPGSAFLVDDQQNRIQVRCRTHDGSVIPRGAELLLLEYDPPSRIFTVARLQRDVPATRSTTVTKARLNSR
jgi:Inner membrane protein YqiJ, N-terminal